MNRIITLGTDSKHASLCADVAHIGTIELITNLSDGLEIDLTMLLDVLAVDAEDVETASLVRERNLDFTIKTSGSEQGRIEDVGPVGRHDALDSAKIFETIKAVEELHQGTLDLTIS